MSEKKELGQGAIDMCKRKALVLMAKAPVPGLVKTRLVPTLSHEDASELSRSFLLDSVELAKCVPSCDIVLAYYPDDALGYFPIECSDLAESIPQGEGGLGNQMQRIFEILLEEGYHSVVIIGTDLPTLPPALIQEAFFYLDYHSIVIGPSTDGGYYLLGLTAMIPEIFEGIDWSTSQVFGQTSERLLRQNVQPVCLHPWYDVDDRVDLDFLIARLGLLRVAGDVRLPRHTMKSLCQMELLPERKLEMRIGIG